MGIVKDLVGEKFGKLTVVAKGAEIEDRYQTWLCRCDCGGEITVNNKRLRRGIVTSCGCIPKNPNKRGTIAKDITGQRFGLLVVQERLPKDKSGKTSWICKCDCGNTVIETSYRLRRGEAKSCGCTVVRSKNDPVDISGKKFERLTALYPTGESDRRNSRIWRCRCDCGNEVEISCSDLAYGNYKSCGCLKKEHDMMLPSLAARIDGVSIDLLRKDSLWVTNTSGATGVYKKRNKYTTRIVFQKKQYNLGCYDSFEEACKVRKAALDTLRETILPFYDAWLERAKNDPIWAEKNPAKIMVTQHSNELGVAVYPKLDQDFDK